MLSKKLKQNPRALAEQLKTSLESHPVQYISSLEIAGPGFLNIKLEKSFWGTLASELLQQKEKIGRAHV